MLSILPNRRGHEHKERNGKGKQTYTRETICLFQIADALMSCFYSPLHFARLFAPSVHLA